MVHNCRRRWEGASAAPDATIFIPAFDFDTRDKSERSPPSSSSDGASNASAVGDSTSPPSPPSSPDRASNAPAVGDGGKCVKLLQTLHSLYDQVRKFTSREVQVAIGDPPSKQRDYRLLDISNGTSTHTNSAQAKFRAIFAERSFALAFEQWELTKHKGLSRVQIITKDLAAAHQKKAGDKHS